MSRIVAQNGHGWVIRDGFPVSSGHTLIIPKRHIGSFFELTPQERDDLMTLLEDAKTALDQEFKPDGLSARV